jgi:hypothetical protein
MSPASVNDGAPPFLTARSARAAVCVVTLATACASGKGATPAPEPATAASNLTRLDSAMPARVDAFVLVDRRGFPDVTDRAYHYQDGSPGNVSVFLYSVNRPGAPSSGSARERVVHEAALFLEILPIQVKRGVYDSFEPLVSRPDSFVIGGMTVPGYLTEARVHRRTATARELQFLHLIGGDYVKLRATVPESRPVATIRSLDSGIVARLVQP